MRAQGLQIIFVMKKTSADVFCLVLSKKTGSFLFTQNDIRAQIWKAWSIRFWSPLMRYSDLFAYSRRTLLMQLHRGRHWGGLSGPLCLLRLLVSSPPLHLTSQRGRRYSFSVLLFSQSPPNVLSRAGCQVPWVAQKQGIFRSEQHFEWHQPFL